MVQNINEAQSTATSIRNRVEMSAAMLSQGGQSMMPQTPAWKE